MAANAPDIVQLDNFGTTLRLRAVRLHAAFVHGTWVGPGAGLLVQALERGFLNWPRRLDLITLINAVLVPGESRSPLDGLTPEQALERDWPADQRSRTIPSQCTFTIDAQHGAVIQGRWLVEPV